MPRRRAFDPDLVLQRAMKHFWEHGYEASSLPGLLEAMQIGRQSMYATFGDKHTLFMSCLQHYHQMGVVDVLEPLAAPGGGLAAIEHYFEDTARRMASPPLRACLMVNSVVELAPHDEAVAALTADFVCRLQQAFAQALDVAVLQQELVVDDIQAEAWRLTSAGLGLSTLSKAGTPPQTLLSVARQVLASMRSGHGST